MDRHSRTTKTKTATTSRGSTGSHTGLPGRCASQREPARPWIQSGLPNDTAARSIDHAQVNLPRAAHLGNSVSAITIGHECDTTRSTGGPGPGQAPSCTDPRCGRREMRPLKCRSRCAHLPLEERSICAGDSRCVVSDAYQNTRYLGGVAKVSSPSHLASELNPLPNRTHRPTRALGAPRISIVAMRGACVDVAGARGCRGSLRWRGPCTSPVPPTAVRWCSASPARRPDLVLSVTAHDPPPVRVADGSTGDLTGWAVGGRFHDW